jgi:uncharacterized protein YjbI with pentapeptide repeats
LSTLPANPITDFLQGGLLLVRRTLFPGGDPGLAGRQGCITTGDCHGVDLFNANLTGVDLSGLNLAGADLSGADVSGDNLSGAHLSGANLAGAHLSGTDLSGADLSGADLYHANLSGTEPLSPPAGSGSNAALAAATVNGHDIGPGASLNGANLAFANLNGANLAGADLTRANLTYAFLIQANLTGAKLTGANLTGAKPDRAILIGVDLTGVELPFGYYIRDGVVRMICPGGCRN